MTDDLPFARVKSLPGALQARTALPSFQCLASRYERPTGPAGPLAWSMDQLDGEFVDVLRTQIIGLDIEIDRLEGNFKLSQNHSAADRARLVAGLRERAHPDDLALAELMTLRASPATDG